MSFTEIKIFINNFEYLLIEDKCTLASHRQWCSLICVNATFRQTLTLVTGACLSSDFRLVSERNYTDSKVHGANVGPTWVLSAPDRPHVGPMNLAIRVVSLHDLRSISASPDIAGEKQTQIFPLSLQYFQWRTSQALCATVFCVTNAPCTVTENGLTPTRPGCSSLMHPYNTVATQIARFIRPTWDPPGSCRSQVDPMMAEWSLLLGQLGLWGVIVLPHGGWKCRWFYLFDLLVSRVPCNNWHCDQHRAFQPMWRLDSFQKISLIS